MKNKEKKVIILDNVASPFVAQAIIILKEDIPVAEDSIIKEAERIVSGYFPSNKKTHPSKRQGFFWGGILFSSFLLFSMLLIKLV